MSSPTAVSTFTLTFGPYLLPTGAPAFVGMKGTVAPMGAVTNVSTGSVIVPVPVEFTIGADGSAQVSGLPHTDQPALSPNGFKYRVRWPEARGQTPPARIFTVPTALGATADYDNLTFSTEQSVYLPVAIGPQGEQGQTGLKGDQGLKGDKGDPGDLTPVDQGNAGATVTVGFSTPRTRVAILTANVTVNALPTPVGTSSFTCTAVLKQAASGGPFTVTWPVGLEWAGDASAPVMPTAANAELVVHVFWTGAAWRAMVGGVFFP